MPRLDQPFFDQLRIIGTNHVAAQSQDSITTAFIEHDPDIVAVELDEQRLASLRSDTSRTPGWAVFRRVGLAGYVFAMTARLIQRRIGKHTGVMPGAEMLHAVDTAQRHGRTVELIDQPVEKTLQAVNNAVGLRMIGRVFADIIKAPFTDPPVRIDATSIPDEDTLVQVTSYMKERYPSFYDALVDQRDAYMARQVFSLLNEGSRVLAVVGAAHVPGMKDYLASYYQANPTVA